MFSINTEKLKVPHCCLFVCYKIVYFICAFINTEVVWPLDMNPSCFQRGPQNKPKKDNKRNGVRITQNIVSNIKQQ